MELWHSLRGTDGEESDCIPRGNNTAWGFMDISANYKSTVTHRQLLSQEFVGFFSPLLLSFYSAFLKNHLGCESGSVTFQFVVFMC